MTGPAVYPPGAPGIHHRDRSDPLMRVAPIYALTARRCSSTPHLDRMRPAPRRGLDRPVPATAVLLDVPVEPAECPDLRVSRLKGREEVLNELHLIAGRRYGRDVGRADLADHDRLGRRKSHEPRVGRVEHPRERLPPVVVPGHAGPVNVGITGIQALRAASGRFSGSTFGSQCHETFVAPAATNRSCTCRHIATNDCGFDLACAP